MTVITADRPARRRRRRGVRRVLFEMRKEWSAYAFLTPAFILLGIFTLFAVGFSLYLSFHRWDILNPQKPYVGLDNYRQLRSDDYFRQAVKNTAYFTLATVPLSILLGLGIALLLNRQIRGRALFRTLFYLPVVTPLVVSGIIWKWVLNGDFGLLNYYIGKIGISPQLWLSDPSLAMPSVVAMSVWATVGFTMLVYLAGLQAIPHEYYEAASVDGAGGWRQFRHITLPLLAPSTFFITVYLIISTFQVFDQIYVMTGGGPLRATTTVVYYIWQAGFQQFAMGYASAMAYGLFAIIFVFTIVQVVIYSRQND
ncbi:MAG TPA: sugar ABC transporter permease [Gaiellales bacterium]|jgi:multiple sugar transport system permease protein|nr:sugar ABC transporter permease [Gaiellales bacterium]